MIKLKETAIKTMADALMAGGRDLEGTSSRAAESSEEIIFLNRKLREAFKISPNPKSAPAPHFTSVKTEDKKNGDAENPPLPTKEDFVGVRTETAMEEKGRIVEAKKEESDGEENSAEKNLEDLRKIKEELERQQKKNELDAEKEKGEKQAVVAAEQEKEKQRISEERAREAEREAAKILQEEKRREEERQAVQEKLRQEKLRAQIETERKKEERRKQLAELETEREKEKLRRADEEKKKREEEEKQAALKAAAEPEDTVPAQTLLTTLEKLAAKLRAQKTNLEKQLSALPDQTTPLRLKKVSLESKVSQIKSTDLAAAVKNENGIEDLETVEKAKLNGKLSIQQEKAVEEKLWEIEEQRKEAEKKRWGVEDGINKISEEIKAIESQIEEGRRKEMAISKKIKNFSGQEKLVVFAQEKWKMEQEMLANVNEREKMTPELEIALSKKGSIAAKMQELTDREESIKNDLAGIEQKEKQSANPTDKRAAEQERWSVNEKLKATIRSKWETEEKLRGEEIKIQGFQEKIDTVNKKIGRIQNIISGNETALEQEGMPVRRIRDEITNIFKENEIEVDSDLLGEIIQPDDLVSRNQEPEVEGSPAKIDETNIPPVAPAAPVPPVQTPTKTEPRNAPAGNIATSIPIRETIKTPEPPKAITPEVAAQAKEPVAAPPPQEAVKISASQPMPIQKPEPVKIEATPAVANTQAPAQNIVPQTAKPVEEPVVTEIKKAVIPVATPAAPVKAETPLPETPTTEMKADFLAPETKLADIIKNARPEIKLERSVPAMNNVPGALAAAPAFPAADIAGGAKPAGGAYREQIAVTPATNIRSFPQPEKTAPVETAPAGRIQRGPTEEDMQILGNADKEGLDVFGEENPAGDVWGDRWGQIKKTTTPAGNPGPVTATPPGATPNVPTDPMASEQNFVAAKPSGNKTLVRIIVVLVLVGIIGIAVTLVLLKNNTPAPVGNGNDPNKEETAKEGDGEENPIETIKPKTTLAVLETKTIPIEDVSSIPNVIFPYLQSPFDADGYYRLVIQNKKDKTDVGLRQFLSVFKVTAPASFYSSASDDFTLFIYSSKGKNRLGFVTTTDNAAGLKAAMTEWEPNMVTNTDNLFKFLGRKTQSATAILKFDSDASTDNVQYRTLNFSPATDNYSIAYAIYKDKYLVFSTSNEALTKIFGQLPK